MDEPRTPTEALDEALRGWVGQSYHSAQEWIRHLVTLCSGGLTLLVSLQSAYVPQHPRMRLASDGVLGFVGSCDSLRDISVIR